MIYPIVIFISNRQSCPHKDIHQCNMCLNSPWITNSSKTIRRSQSGRLIRKFSENISGNSMEISSLHNENLKKSQTSGVQILHRTLLTFQMSRQCCLIITRVRFNFYNWICKTVFMFRLNNFIRLFNRILRILVRTSIKAQKDKNYLAVTK